MCDVCCKEIRGWCKSFTRIESWLVALEALLFIVLIGLVSFLIFHLLVCTAGQGIETPAITNQSVQIRPHPITDTNRTTSTAVTLISTTTLSPDIECTWTPSHKTEATAHYYWNRGQATEKASTSKHREDEAIINENVSEPDVSVFENNTNGYDASQTYQNYVAALVKLKPPEDVTFGCILTKVTRYWTLTAASCIESIEEVDSLDSFFIMDSYGEMQQVQSHAVADVQIHPQYQGANRSYDLAALRSEDALIPSSQLLLQLPTMLEYFLVAVGERFTILGYGGYRSLDKSPRGRRLRAVGTYTVSLGQCAAAEAWAPRHLAGGGALAAGACGAGACGPRALCGAGLRARAAPCSYCGGTPLLRAGKLFGIMAHNRHCGVACEPTLYVNVAALRDWLDSVATT